MIPVPSVVLLLPIFVGTQPSAGEFVASSPADDRPAGRLLKLTTNGSAELATADGMMTVADLVALHRVGVPAPPLPRCPALLTTTGDRIPGRLVGGDGQSLRFRPTLVAEDWTVPLTAAAVVWLTRPPADTPADPAAYPWLADHRKRDVLLLRNGDVLPGTLDGFAADPPAFRFKPEAGPTRTVPFAEAAALAFNPALARSRKPKGPFARLVLRDGTRLAVADPTADGESVSGKTLFGQSVVISIDKMIGLGFAQGKAVYLSDLKPAAVEQVGFLGTTWPWTADRSVKGTPLRLRTPSGDHTFDRGLGTHPRTILTYNLDGKYRRFEAMVGIDAAAARTGRAAVKVVVDGKEQPLPELARLGPGPAVPARVDVRGAKELKLVIDFGADGDVGADVGWGDARVVE